MRIVCPSCDAAYEVPDTVLARPRLMRCARCAHEFRPPGMDNHATAGSDAEIAEPGPGYETRGYETGGEETGGQETGGAETRDEATGGGNLDDMRMDAEPDVDGAAAPLPPEAAPMPPPAVSRREQAQVLAAWAGSILAVFLLVWLGIACRRPVMHAWPASARLYAVLGYRLADTTAR